MEIALIVLVFIALLLYIVWLPFFKGTSTGVNNNSAQENPKNNIRDETNVQLYKEHKAEIEKDFSDGGIDEENYQYLLAELDSSLLQDIEAAKKESNVIVSNKHFSVLWPLSLSLFIIAFSIVLYLKQGTLTALMTTPNAKQSSQQEQMSGDQQAQAQQEQQEQQEQILAYITQLQQHLEKNVDDGEAWYKLGQTLVSVGEFDMAITAFNEVIRIEGEQADLLGAIAQAHYYRNNQQIDEQVQSFIDRALALDINDPSTNILMGMHNFIAKEYEQAIGYWQRVIDTKKQGVNINALQEAVNEAKSRLGMPSMNSNQPEKAQATGPTLNVSISLADDVAQQLAQGEDKVVFVYAIPTDGQRMPLAAMKFMASDLPKVITLSNDNAMSPANNLSSVSEVHIYAVVSNQGGVGIKSGDFKAEIQNISVDNTDTLSLVIDSLVE
ncbi:c-type cytochrome biogenesis protein CcmI [Candidatus Colwellia aromaticivorans]|uniref:c-type cytochrome biogenesis protein CcmI n=1 Tax=Candidatus Colwellia aromaticivorans TaxID=2267621 RepID=UPI000DF4140C|nr:c-type cytochrome biogenesis protein CcmI [Candidatus Colwellia aromaticivorans]